MENSINRLIRDANVHAEFNPNDISDGHHTFGELYRHRHMLFIALMKLATSEAWISKTHNDGTSYDGWFIAGMYLPGNPPSESQISYHLPMKYWDMASEHSTVLDRGERWDGHNSDDVVKRLETFVLGIPF